MPLINTRGVVTARGYGFSAVGAVAPVNTVAPVVSGTAQVGQTLSTTNGTWTGTAPITYTYQWQQGTSNIGGATSSTYVIQASDVGYTLRCVVTATNSVAAVSANSNSTATVPPVTGQTQYTTPGTYTFVVPAGVTSVSVFCVGGGGSGSSDSSNGFYSGGGGGGTGYYNGMYVTPGQSWEVNVGAGGAAVSGSSYGNDGAFSSFHAPGSFNTALYGNKGIGGGNSGNRGKGGLGGTYYPPNPGYGVSYGGANGGSGGGGQGGQGSGGGGGAGGYSGNGGNGQDLYNSTNATAGSGGAGGGAGAGQWYNYCCCVYGTPAAGSGGGVGLQGQGANGAAGSYYGSGAGGSGSGGSGQSYGGGGGGGGTSSGSSISSSAGGSGAVRIIWPGTTRYFPSTNTANM